MRLHGEEEQGTDESGTVCVRRGGLDASRGHSQNLKAFWGWPDVACLLKSVYSVGLFKILSLDSSFPERKQGPEWSQGQTEDRQGVQTDYVIQAMNASTTFRAASFKAEHTPSWMVVSLVMSNAFDSAFLSSSETSFPPSTSSSSFSPPHPRWPHSSSLPSFPNIWLILLYVGNALLNTSSSKSLSLLRGRVGLYVCVMYRSNHKSPDQLAALVYQSYQDCNSDWVFFTWMFRSTLDQTPLLWPRRITACCCCRLFIRGGMKLHRSSNPLKKGGFAAQLPQPQLSGRLTFNVMIRVRVAEGLHTQERFPEHN